MGGGDRVSLGLLWLQLKISEIGCFKESRGKIIVK